MCRVEQWAYAGVERVQGRGQELTFNKALHFDLGTQAKQAQACFVANKSGRTPGQLVVERRDSHHCCARDQAAIQQHSCDRRRGAREATAPELLNEQNPTDAHTSQAAKGTHTAYRPWGARPEASRRRLSHPLFMIIQHSLKKM